MNITRKLLMTTAIILLPSIAIAQTKGSITFVVDENLAPIEEPYNYLANGERLAKSVLHQEDIPEGEILQNSNVLYRSVGRLSDFFERVQRDV